MSSLFPEAIFSYLLLFIFEILRLIFFSFCLLFREIDLSTRHKVRWVDTSNPYSKGRSTRHALFAGWWRGNVCRDGLARFAISRFLGKPHYDTTLVTTAQTVPNGRESSLSHLILIYEQHATCHKQSPNFIISLY